MESDANKIFIDKPVVQVEDKLFKGPVSNVTLQHHILRNVGAKGVVFTDVDFSYSVFERSYFHNCKFINCTFTGCRFVECNFRGAIFDNCKLQYLTLRLTHISYKELLVNLPPWPNVKRELMRSFRINADSMGDVEASKAFVRGELEASREHLRKARDANEAYYSSTYKGFKNRVEVYWDSFCGFFDWHLWGHGEYPHKLLLSLMFFLLGAVAVLMVQSGGITSDMSLASFSNMFSGTAKNVVYVFLGVKASGVSDGWVAILSLIRYVSLSLFVTVLYKRLVRR